MKNAILHHLRWIQISFKYGDIRIIRLCPKSRYGYRCGGGNWYGECGK